MRLFKGINFLVLGIVSTAQAAQPGPGSASDLCKGVYHTIFRSMTQASSHQSASRMKEGTIALAELKTGESIGNGSFNTAYLVNSPDSSQIQRVLILDKVLDPRAGYTSSLSTQELAELQAITITDAQKMIAQLDSLSEAPENKKTFQALAHRVAWHIREIEYAKGLKGLHYQGHEIAPQIFQTVVDDRGLRVGYLMELLPGKSAERIFLETGGSDEFLEEVVRQVREQVKILHDAGKVHGDISPANTIVEFLGNRKIRVRLVDFSSSLAGGSEKPNFAKDLEGILNLESHLRALSK